MKYTGMAAWWQEQTLSHKALLLSLGLIGILWIGILACVWWQPILADEIQVYNSAVHWPDGPMRVNPPLYMYSVRLSFWLLGQSVSSARLPGVLSGFITLWLIPAVVRLAMRPSDLADWTATVAVWLYACNPMAIQNMMILGVDTSWLMPAMLALVWAWLKLQSQPAWQRIVGLSLVFVLALWVKLLSPFLTLGAIALFYLLQGRFKQMLEIAAATGLGAVVFWATIQTNVTRPYVFGYTGGYLHRLNLLNPANVRFMATTFPQAAGVFALWLSLPLMILLGIAAFQTLKHYLHRQTDTFDAFLLYAGCGSIAYAAVIYPAWGYPYYHAPFLPILVIVAATILTPVLFQLSRPAQYALIALAGLSFLYYRFIIGDPLLRLYMLTYETQTGQLAARLQQGGLDLLRLAVPIALGLGIGLLLAQRLTVSRKAWCIAALGVLTLSGMLATTHAQITARYSTRYRYGYNFDNMMQAVRRVQEHVGPQGYIAAIDDILFYTGLEGDGIYGMATQIVNRMGQPSVNVLDLVRQRPTDALVWTTKDAVRNPGIVNAPEMTRILKECYTLETYGVFLVYLRNSSITCP